MTAVAVLNMKPKMYAEWSKFIKGHVDLPSISVYKDFLKELSRTLRRDAEDEHQLFIPIKKKSSRAMIHLADKTTQCGLCRETFHLLYLYSTFNSTNPEKRLQMAKQQSACTNCLTVGHKPKDCRSIKRCRTCNGRHHSLLHLETRISKPADSNQLPHCCQPSNRHGSRHIHIIVSCLLRYL